MQQQIIDAFGQRKLPSAVTNVTVCSTLRDDALRFEGMDWRDVTANDWRENSDAYYGLSPEAFAYFLPSILTLSLDRANVPFAPAEALIASLDTSADPDIWPEWFTQRFGMLTLHEVGALKNWSLVYLAGAELDEGSEFQRVQDTLEMLELSLQG